MPLNLERERVFIKQIPEFGKHLDDAIGKIQEGVNNANLHIGVDALGMVHTPPPVQQLTVKTNGTGMVHAVITDNNAIQKNLEYFVEYDTNPDFRQPHVEHLGASRSMKPVMLPAMDDNGNPQKFYFRAYSQYRGSDPNTPVHFGGEVPTAVNPGGTQQMTLIPSTGSGTAQPTGQQGGSGLGKVLFRPAPTPKRTTK